MKRVVVWLLGLLLVIAIVAAGTGYVLYQRINQSFRGYETETQLVEIPAGEGPRTIGERLIAAGVVRDSLTFRLALWVTGDARKLKAGAYRFDRPLTAADVVGKIARGEVDLIPITFREGLTIAEMAKVFEASGLGPAAAFVEAAGDAAAIRALDPAARDLEGYLFPDTYNVPRNTDAGQLTRAMIGRVLQVLTPELRQAAEARGLTVRQLVTLASNRGKGNRPGR